MGLIEGFVILGICWIAMGSIVALKRLTGKVGIGSDETARTVAYATGYALAEDNLRLYFAIYHKLPSKQWMKKASLSILDTRDKMLAFNASKE
jgi:hypothetical protein